MLTEKQPFSAEAVTTHHPSRYQIFSEFGVRFQALDLTRQM